MSDEASKVPAYNAVPCGALSAVKLYGCQRAVPIKHSRITHLLLDELGDVLDAGVSIYSRTNTTHVSDPPSR